MNFLSRKKKVKRGFTTLLVFGGLTAFLMLRAAATEVEHYRVIHRYNSESQLIGFMVYSENGQLVKQATDCLENGDCEYWEERDYDETGNLKEVIRKTREGSISDSTAYEYSTEGILTRRSFWLLDRSVCVQITEYDAHGNPVLEKNLQGEEWKDTFRFLNSYDEEGRLCQIETYGEDETLTECKVYSYEEEKRLVREEIFDGEKRKLGSTLLLRDEKGRTVSCKELDVSGMIETETRYRYDSYGNVSEETVLSGEGKITCRIVSSYSPEGIPNSRVYYDENGEVVVREQAVVQ